MTEKKTATGQQAAQVEPRVLDAMSVLAASVNREKARKGTDLELLESLELTILRVDTLDGSWEKAADAIKKLALLRAASRLNIP